MTTATDWERLLSSGISAYQKGEYERAIATFKRMSQCPRSTLRTKAGMGLVRAYMSQKEWHKARTLCRTIGRSSKPAVQTWATTTLEKIESRSQSVPAVDNLSGFVPLEPETLPAQQSKTQKNKTQKNKTQKSKTQNSEAQKSIPTLRHTASNRSVLPSTHVGQLSDQKEQYSAESLLPTDTGVSMFHYAYLNGELDETNKSASRAEVEGGHSYEWRNAGRLRTGRSLGKMKRQPLWIAQTLGAIAFYCLVLMLSNRAAIFYNKGLNVIDRITPSFVMRYLPFDYLPEYWGYLVWKVALALGVVAIASPWLWDLRLRFTTGRQVFTNAKLRHHSPEAASLLTKFCQKRRWPLPKIWKIASDVPLLFSYGWLPRNARLVVSNGLLEALSEDEIATLVGYEIAHWRTFYWPLLSVQSLVVAVLHQIYWSVSLWGNERSGFIRGLAGIISSTSYALFWIVRLPGMWINRVRTYYGDRTASQLTGNPNALTRALTKFSFALADSTAHQGYTPPAVECFALLLPVSRELTRSRLYGEVALSDLFAWDSQHPLRNWMSLLDTHPPLGDRLRLLMAYARHWKLDQEIPLDPLSRKRSLSRADWSAVLRQGKPYFGLAIGAAVGLLCLLVGATGRWLEWPAIDWMHEDPGIFWFCPLMGFGLGTFLRINRFFPDLTLKMQPSTDLAERVCDKTLLPVDSLATKLSGTVIGRPGLANWLGQDLIIKTSADKLIKLHFFSTWDAPVGPLNPYFLLALGPFGNLLSKCDRPSLIIGKSVQILGWFRRGNHVWLDVDKIRLSNGRLIENTHPTTSLLLAIAASASALWVLGFGEIFQAAIDKLG